MLYENGNKTTHFFNQLKRFKKLRKVFKKRWIGLTFPEISGSFSLTVSDLVPQMWLISHKKIEQIEQLFFT